MAEQLDQKLLQNLKSNSTLDLEDKIYFQSTHELFKFLLSLYNVPALVILCCLCFIINIWPLFNLLLRPSLWSTVNTFLAFTLVLTIFHGCGLFILAILTPYSGDFDPNFSNINSTSDGLSQPYTDWFCHGFMTLRNSTGSMIVLLLIGCLFIRAMVTIRTDLFTTEKIDIDNTTL